jgi:hypothetical protein
MGGSVPPDLVDGRDRMIEWVTWIVIVLILLFIFTGVSWFVHIEMTTGNTLKHGWGSYSTFKYHFAQYEWSNENGHYKGSLWNREEGCEYHASIIKIGGVGMLINNPFSYILVVIYMWKFTRRGRKQKAFFKKPSKQKSLKKDGYLVDLGDGQSIFVSMEEIYGKQLP